MAHPVKLRVRHLSSAHRRGLVWLCPTNIDRQPLKLNNFLALFRKKASLLLPKLMLRGGGTFSSFRRRCKRSSWSMLREICRST